MVEDEVGRDRLWGDDQPVWKDLVQLGAMKVIATGRSTTDVARRRGGFGLSGAVRGRDCKQALQLRHAVD